MAAVEHTKTDEIPLSPGLSAAHNDDGVPMVKVMKRHSISESFSIFKYPLLQVPPSGARIKVCFAGACIAEGQVDKDGQRRLRSPGIQDTSLFQGFEVCGIVCEIGSGVDERRLQIDDRVLVYPRDQELTESGFAEYITVKDAEDLIKIPDELAMQTAATLPAGALRAYSAMLRAKPFIEDKLSRSSGVTVLIVGAGAMGLLTLKLARYCIPASTDPNRVFITVADTNLTKLQLAKEEGCSEIIHWDEAIHEEYIVMRTTDACKGGADIIIDFVGSPRSITRSMNVLKESGVMLVGGNAQYEVLIDLARLAHYNHSIVGVPQGTKDQLQDLIQLFISNQKPALAVSVYPLAEADRVFDMLSQGHIVGRAVLQVCSNHSEHDNSASSMAIYTKSVPASQS